MASETTFDYWQVFFSCGKVRKRALTFKALAPYFKTYIFGIVLQFPTIWLEKNDGYFFDLTGLQDPCE